MDEFARSCAIEIDKSNYLKYPNFLSVSFVCERELKFLTRIEKCPKIELSTDGICLARSEESSIQDQIISGEDKRWELFLTVIEGDRTKRTNTPEPKPWGTNLELLAPLVCLLFLSRLS